MRIKKIKIGAIVSIVLLITVTFCVRSSPVEGAMVVWTENNVYQRNETIKVIFSNAPGYDTDWICIVTAGSPDTDPGDYQYMPKGLNRGSLIFDSHPPGEYEVRAYYNYRRDGYMVSGRYPFTVEGYSAEEGLTAQDAEPIDPYGSPETDVPPTETYISPEADIPPPVSFVAPPNVVVLPGFDVYAVPDVGVDIFFQGGWWWRPWGGRWYRSRYYDHGWSYHRDPPPWYKKIPHNWRQSYRNHTWSGRPWNPPRINQSNLNNHWRGGRWRNDHGLGRPGKSVPSGGRSDIVRPSGPGKPIPPAVGPGSVRPGGGPGKPTPPAVVPGRDRPTGGHGQAAPPVVGPGSGRSDGVSGKPGPPSVGRGGSQPGGGPGKSAPPVVGPGGGQSGGGRSGGRSGGDSDKPLRGFGFENPSESGGR